MKNNLLDESVSSVTISFVSDVNKFLPQVEALYLDEVIYFSLSLISHIIVVLGALFVKDIRIIFDLIGCIGGTFIMFIAPSVTFILIFKTYGRKRHRRNIEYTCYQVLAYLLFILGMISFGFTMTANIMSLTGSGEGVHI